MKAFWLRLRRSNVATITICLLALLWITWNFLPMALPASEAGNTIFNAIFSVEASMTTTFLVELAFAQQKRLEELITNQNELLRRILQSSETIEEVVEDIEEEIDGHSKEDIHP